MKQTLLVVFFILSAFIGLAQHSFFDDVKNIKGLTITKQEHDSFKEYYEVLIEQPLDHFNSKSLYFKQRIFVGFNNVEAPIVMETEGYAINNVSLPVFMKDCNLISVEHRYFGKSVPDSLNWNYLTIKQAAFDLHRVHETFSKLFKGKWMATGISKGGQTSVAYKLYFPNDVAATLAYVTPIKKSINDNRISDYFKSIALTESGKKVIDFQHWGFKNKANLIPIFNTYISKNNYSFSKMNNEKVLEYMLLEYPFAFFQKGLDSKLIPDSSASMDKVLDELIFVVPPKFYSDAFRSKLEPSFYMFYHELGYYEYDLNLFKEYLSSNTYSNAIFAPENINIVFDTNYLNVLNAFIKSADAKNIIFIYGENDPYTALQAAIDENKDCIKLIVKNGSHKSRANDLTPEQQLQLYKQLSSWLNWKIN